MLAHTPPSLGGEAAAERNRTPGLEYRLTCTTSRSVGWHRKRASTRNPTPASFLFLNPVCNHQAMDRIGATLARTTARPLVTPRAVRGLVTRKVVVMDYLAGVPLSRSLQMMKVCASVCTDQHTCEGTKDTPWTTSIERERGNGFDKIHISGSIWG